MIAITLKESCFYLIFIVFFILLLIVIKRVLIVFFVFLVFLILEVVSFGFGHSARIGRANLLLARALYFVYR